VRVSILAAFLTPWSASSRLVQASPRAQLGKAWVFFYRPLPWGFMYLNNRYHLSFARAGGAGHPFDLEPTLSQEGATGKHVGGKWINVSRPRGTAPSRCTINGLLALRRASKTS